MKFLVVSDLHGFSPVRICDMAPAYDGLIFLGDGAAHLPVLQKSFPVVHAVRGNCDPSSCGLPEEKELFIEGQRLLLTHGHRYGVKWGLSILASEAHARGCAAALFGHTHTPTLTFEEGVLLCNPGAVESLSSSYGVLDVRRDGVLFSAALFAGGIIL